MFLIACGVNKQVNTNDTQLKNIVENKSFNIKFNWASPQVTTTLQQLGNARLFPNGSTPGNIDITSNTNYLKMENDSVKAFLPFFGERRFGGGYNNTNSIEFEGLPTNLKVTQGNLASYEIRFDINDKNYNAENYNVFITLFPNLSIIININSSHRTSIQYRGNAYGLNDVN